MTKGDVGGRTGADSFCSNWSFKIPKNLNSCSNIRALISISSTDEVRDMPSNYSLPSDKPVFNERGHIIADNLTHLVSGNNLYNKLIGIQELFPSGNSYYWTGTSSGGELNSNNCSGFSSDGGNGQIHVESRFYFGESSTLSCGNSSFLICLCF